MKFDRNNKFDFCYYGQVNSLWLKLSVASKLANKHFWGLSFILLLKVHLKACGYHILHKHTNVIVTFYCWE